VGEPEEGEGGHLGHPVKGPHEAGGHQKAAVSGVHHAETGLPLAESHPPDAVHHEGAHQKDHRDPQRHQIKAQKSDPQDIFHGAVQGDVQHCAQVAGLPLQPGHRPVQPIHQKQEAQQEKSQHLPGPGDGAQQEAQHHKQEGQTGQGNAICQYHSAAPLVDGYGQFIRMSRGCIACRGHRLFPNSPRPGV
jgi:hypothetical protein